MQGRRLPDNVMLERLPDSEPGSYGVVDLTPAGSGASRREWWVCCPDGGTTQLWVHEDDPNGRRHIVTEHPNGSISVDGSILSGLGWHGWLNGGVWTPV